MRIKNMLWLVAVAWAFFQSRGTSLAQGWLLSTAPTNVDWSHLAASADGRWMIACTGGEAGTIYTSSDFGVNWATDDVPALSWTSVASSADGSKLVAAAVFGGVYISTNYGGSWTQTQAPTGDWWAVGSSADGIKLAAVVGGQSGLFTGNICVSTNAGTNWAVSDSPTANWSAIAMSADGTKLAATIGPPQAGPIYNSSDSGQTWTTNNNAPVSSWVSVASSADGSELIAANTSAIYTSVDSGINWTSNRLPALTWSGVASSADGAKLVAVAQEAGDIFTSTNGGATWITNAVPQRIWWSVASSADGNRLVAAVVPDQTGTNGGIYSRYSESSPRLDLANWPTASFKLSWLVPSTNFILQQSPDLSVWAETTNAPVLNLTNLQDQVVLPLTASNLFYRLKTP